MRIVIALFLFGATNSASIFKNPPANAEIEYGYRDNRLTSISIDYSIDRVVQANAVAENVVPDTSSSQSFYKVDDGKLEQVNPTHISYTYGIGLGGHASTAQQAPIPAVQTYAAPPASALAADHMGMNYYKVDDGQLDQVNPTHMSYSAPAPAVASISSPDSFDATYYKVDDGQLEQVNPTHITYYDSAPVTTPVARVRSTSRGRIEHAQSSVPSMQYMATDYLFGATVVPTQKTAPVAQPVHISGPQAVIEEVVASPALKSAEIEPYLLSGPVAEYTIPFGVDIPGIDFTADGLSQPSSVPVKYNPAPEVITYSSAPLAEPMVDNYYKVDDGQLEQVIPTHVSYDSYVPAPIAKTSSRGRVQPISGPVPAVDIYEAPAVSSAVKIAEPEPYILSGPVAEYTIPFGIDIPGIDFTADGLSQPLSVPVKFNPAPEVVAYSSAPSADPMVEHYYEVDDGRFENVNPTHVSYSSPKSIPIHLQSPEVMTYAAPMPAYIPAPAYTPAAPLLETLYNVDDGQLKQVNPTHVSYSTHVSIPQSITYSSPEPVVFSPVPEVAVKFDSSPFNAITNMLQTFYTQDDGELEKVTPTHISYSDPMPAIQEPIPAVTLWTPNSVDKKDLTPAVEVTQYNSVATSLPIIKSPSKYTQYMPVEDLLGSTFTSSVKVVNVEVAPAPTPAKIWWTPDPVDKKDLTPTVKAVKVEVAEEKAEVKKSEEEPIVDEEEGGDDVTHVESNSTDEADKGAEDSEGSEGSERAVEAEGSEGDEGAEEDKVTEEDPNTKSEGEEESVDEAETKSEGAEEEEEDSDEKKR